MSEPWKKILVWSCTHHPLDDKDTTAWRISQIKEYRPDIVVNLGDWLDADAASRWPNEHEWELEDEYKAVAADALAVREAAPDAKRVWILGNHDDNIQAPNRIPKKLRSLVLWPNYQPLKDALAGWTIIPYHHRSYYRVGQVTFQHGCETSINGDKDQCNLYGVEQGLWCGGHSHRPVRINQVMITPKIPRDRWYCNVGCGCDFGKMEYVRRKNIATWGHAILKVRANTSQNRHNWASRQWEPDPGIVVHKMAHGQEAV